MARLLLGVLRRRASAALLPRITRPPPAAERAAGRLSIGVAVRLLHVLAVLAGRGPLAGRQGAVRVELGVGDLGPDGRRSGPRDHAAAQVARVSQKDGTPTDSKGP